MSGRRSGRRPGESGAARGEWGRVVHVIESGDTSGLFRAFARHHDSGRWPVSFVTLRDPDPTFAHDLAVLGVEVRGLGVTGRSGLPAGAARLAGHLLRRRPEVVHAHLFQPSLVAMTAGLLARTPVRIVTRHHAESHTRAGRWLPVALDRYASLLAHRVVAVSSYARRAILEHEQADPDRVVAIPNGVAAERFAPPDPEVVRGLRAELAHRGERVLLVPARLHPEKGHPYLFRAVARLVDEVPSVRVWLAGEGRWREAYRKEVRALGLTDRVDFLGFRDDIAAVMMAADVVVVPSRVEAFGMVVLEARALGKAVVATRVGEIPALLDQGRAGLLVPPADDEALARALARVLGDPELRAALEARGGAQVLEAWSVERMVGRYEELYEEVRRVNAVS